jgi:hypothetical protein
VFSVPVGGGEITTLAGFNNTDGADPAGDLIRIGRILFGTALYGGPTASYPFDYGSGTVFSAPVK